MVPGIILAAGESSRMGRPKALLPISNGGPTFLRHVAAALVEGGVPDVLVVARPDDLALGAEVDSIGVGVRLVVNLHPELGQLSSVVAGVNAADRPGVHGVLVTPVDAPLIRAATVRTLLAAFSASAAPVVRPVHRGQHGHPVIFARQVFDELRHADPSLGAKAVVRAHAADAIAVDVDDPGVLDDVDDPGQYGRVFNQTE